MKTMDARHARGIGRKAGVRQMSTSTMMSAVNMPCIGVHSLPALCATSAERESEPAAGYERKKAPKMLAAPIA